MIFQINLLTAVMNDAPVLPDEDDEVERYKSIFAIHQYVMHVMYVSAKSKAYISKYVN